MTDLIGIAQQCAFFKIRKASRVITQIYDHYLKPTGLAPTQFSLLVALSIWGPVAVSRLAEALVMDRTTLSRNLKPLERKGLIQGVPGSDRRTRTLELTPAGREALEVGIPLWEQAQAHMARQLGPEAWRRLTQTLDEAVDRLRI